MLMKHEDDNEYHFHEMDRKFIIEAMEEYSNTRNQKLESLAKILAKTWFYGDWKWETPNERVMQMLMTDLGYYPFIDEDEMIKHTKVNEDLYKQAIEQIKSK